MDRDIELLIRRATPLLFGVFGHMPGRDERRTVRFGGSGVFVAPFLAVTARHVSRDLLRLDWRGERPPSRGYFETQYSSAIFQIRDWFEPKRAHAIWQVDRTWDSLFTDISLMQVSAQSGVATEMQEEMPSRFFEWALLPPPIGSQVLMLGYPETEIDIVGDKMNIGLTFVLQIGKVCEIHPLRRDSGMITFPCFHIDKPVNHGFSGGPVFWGDKLCGIVSSGSIDNGTYAATLWPFCLMECEFPGLGSFGSKMTVGDLFEKRVVKSQEWQALRSRISKRHDENGRPYAHIEDVA